VGLIWPMRFFNDATDEMKAAAAESSARARASDPASSHLAAQSIEPILTRMERTILGAASRTFGMTSFELASQVESVYPGRWDEGSIRTRVSALGKAGRLVKATETGLSPRGHVCDRWLLP